MQTRRIMLRLAIDKLALKLNWDSERRSNDKLA